VILKITYGYTAEAHGADPFVDLAGKTMETFAEATVPGKWMVDVMPFLKYLPDGCPGTGFKDVGRKMHNTLKQCVEQPYAFVKQQMREKRNSPSFLSQAIEEMGTDAEMEFVNKWAALSLFTGGADTVSPFSSLSNLLSALLHIVDRIIAHDLFLGHDGLPRCSKEGTRRARPRHWN
jgi:hypothetical protein